MADIDYDAVLKESYPYKIYEELNNQVKNVENEEKCNAFKDIASTHKDTYVTLCNKVSKLLDFVFKKDTSENFKEYCSHYRNWVYQEIWNLFKEGKSNDDIEGVINKFNKLQIDLFIKHRKRNCSFGFDIKNLQGLKYNIEEKYLYDYFKNYNTIKSSETCNKCNNGKYREYLKSVSDIYNNVKEYCCSYGTSVCDNYFLTCKNEFDPSELLSALLSKGSENCDGLSSITANFNEEKLNSVVTDSEVLNSITHGACINLNNRERASDNTTQQNFCLLATSALLTKNSPTDEIDRPYVSRRESPLRRANSGFGEHQAEVELPKGNALQGQPDAKGIRGDFGEISVKIEAVPPVKDAPGPIRWKFNEKGTLQCPTKSRDKYEELLCKYMDVLVEGKFATQMEGTKRYKVQAGKSWTKDDLKLARERVRKRRSANESNILNNIFVRISTGVTLFTPFGSRLRRDRKRKQRYRKDFTDLYTRKRPRRFLKRTYRHSDRRRFNVVNIEDQLHS
ncbi:PIR Superfamily Protein [Plasmodium malariae]|uniref:PIR Superfamily Protein n=1 Tax=Plasmodium malariae TaxID=5858 RepID=A0A1A8X4W1_PLAMA|nr:PIR Superfamily Protein [Plasmodium malariae]